MSSAKIVALSSTSRHIAFDDALGETFGNRRLADARVAHIKRVVLGTAAQDLDGAVDLVGAADQRVDLAGLGLGVQIDAIGRQGVLLLLRLAVVFRLLVCPARSGRRRAARRRCSDAPGRLAMPCEM
jgi:hypothetical protein